jgi:hypothetical protein
MAILGEVVLSKSCSQLQYQRSIRLTACRAPQTIGLFLGNIEVPFPESLGDTAYRDTVVNPLVLIMGEPAVFKGAD